MLQWATAPLPVRATSTGRFQNTRRDDSSMTSLARTFSRRYVQCRREARRSADPRRFRQACAKFAAKVFNADKTYFVLNGTSAANKVVTNALLTRGDLVLFDRNNHKSNHHGALIQAGATPVYLEAARNPFGFIGGIDEHCFDDAYLRNPATLRRRRRRDPPVPHGSDPAWYLRWHDLQRPSGDRQDRPSVRLHPL